MDLGIKGKVALVTGGNKGIGKAAALELAREGCNVAITGRNAADLAAVEKEIKALGVEALAIAADMEKADGPLAASISSSTMPGTPSPARRSARPMRIGPAS